MPLPRHHLGWSAPLILVLTMAMLGSGCSDTSDVGGSDETATKKQISLEDYENKVHGAWQAIMVANHSGLDLQGRWLDEPGADDEIELLFPDQWSTDDDTHIEWLDIHIMETHGIDPSYQQIRDEWVDHLNGDIWVSTLRARELMDDGVLPPETGSADLNPDGVWSMDAQLETELFGLISPGQPLVARERASYFAKVTNSGLAVDVSAFYSHLYASAFFEDDIAVLLDLAVLGERFDSLVFEMVAAVRGWHLEQPNDWRATRAKIAEAYDDDPNWWASKVNFAVTLMALLYGEGDLIETIHIAGLAGWDSDNNMTTAAGLLGIFTGSINCHQQWQILPTSTSTKTCPVICRSSTPCPALRAGRLPSARWSPQRQEAKRPTACWNSLSTRRQRCEIRSSG